MKVEIQVPRMGESINEATVATILKPTGSRIAVDDEVLELETDKVNQVVYASQAGVVTWSVKPEEVVKIGQVIGVIDTDGTVSLQPQEQERPKEAKPIVSEKPEKKEQPKASEPAVRLGKEEFVKQILAKEEPPARKIPSRNSSEPSLTKQDGRETRRKMSRIRKVIAARLVEAQHTTAMLTTFNEIDMSEVVKIREEKKESFQKEHGVKLGFMSFFVKATVSALKAFPDLNSYIDGDEIVHRDYYDLGIAIGTDKGLIVPVVRNCDQLSYSQIEKAIGDYAKKAKDGDLTADELQGGGFTITNGGTYGSLLSTPILNPPQCGILGMHKMMKRPVVVEDQIVIRQMMYVALSYDHRLVDGKTAVSFLVHIKEYLEKVKMLLDN